MGLCSAKSQKGQNLNEKKKLLLIQFQKVNKSERSIQTNQQLAQTPKKQLQPILSPSPSTKPIKRTAWADTLIENSKSRGTLKTYISIKNTTFSKHYSIVNQEKLKHSLKNHEQYALIQHNLSGKVRVAELIKKSNEGNLLVQEIVKGQLQHPNMIRIYEIFQDGINYEIIHEFCNSQTLQLNLNQTTYTQKQVAIMIKQIIDIVQYLHTYGFHHDFLTLKSFQKSDSENNSNYIKLIDYKSIYIKPTHIEKDSIHYLSPEAIKIPEMYSFERDIWSIGVILYKLLSGKYPFEGSNLDEIYASIVEYSSTDNLDFGCIPEQCISLIKSFLQVNPKQRVKLANALDHEWLSKFIKESQEELENIIKQIENNHALNFLQCCFLQFMISTFLQEQELHLYQIFRLFDSNHDGKLNRKDVFQAYLRCGNNIQEVREQVDAIFKGMDLKKSGEIDFQEFLIGVIDRNQLLTQENLKEAFKLLSDIEGNISLQKMISLYTNKKQALKTHFSIYDNHQINYKQFEELMYDAI